MVNAIRFGVVCSVLLTAASASAQQLPDDPGKDLLLKVCGGCHQPERSASVRLTREGWEEVIADMIKRGAKGTDEEFGTVLEYLTKHFLGDAPRPLNINRATTAPRDAAGIVASKKRYSRSDHWFSPRFCNTSAMRK